MHRLLARQLRRSFGKDGDVPSELKPLIDAVDQAYSQFDEDRIMLERSLELSSDELLRSNSELHALFSSLPELFLRVTVDENVVGAPGGLSDDINLVPGATGGGPLRDLLVPAAWSAIAPALGLLSAQPERKHATVRYDIDADDGKHYFEARFTRLPFDEVMIVIRETTDSVLQAHAESARREQAARMHAMEEFAYVASHDLRSPLRAIHNLAEWIAEDLDGKLEGETQEHLDLLRQRVLRMDRLLVDLLDYCRVGHEDVTLAEVDVQDMVSEVVDLLDAQGFTFDVGDMPRMETAAGPLQRVFLNLITNAVKHHDTGAGRIHVGCADPEADVLTFWVEDDGPGIPADARGGVFKLFKTLKGKDNGSGMGLALIQRIVEEGGGRIWIEDGNLGGVRFAFTWRRAAQERAAE